MMTDEYISYKKMADFKSKVDHSANRTLLSITLEITARCNNNCRHCYVNLPEKDKTAADAEMSYNEITDIIDEAVSLGALWCTFTGGEPLLRDDFSDLYLYAKKKGLLTSVLTNATLITDEHVELFKTFPLRNLEISVYGISQETYERVSCVKGSFEKFEYGLNKLIKNHIPVSLKSPAIASNYEEYKKIISFCREHSREGYVKFDPLIFFRTDGNKTRNKLIEKERLSPEKLKQIKDLCFSSHFEELDKIKEESGIFIQKENIDGFFTCTAGKFSCKIGYDAQVSPCPLFYHPQCLYDLRKGSLTQAWQFFIPRAAEKFLYHVKYPEQCHGCDKIGKCLWCPAMAYTEQGSVNTLSEYACLLTKYF